MLAMRWRLDRLPAAAWAALGAAAIAVLFAFAASPQAAALMALAGAACFWAARQARRFIIAPGNSDKVDLADLSELAPLLEALPDPALLVDEQARITGSNAAARQQMSFEARGQYLTSIIRHPDVLEAVQSAVNARETRAVEFETPVDGRHTRCYAAPLNWSGRRGVMLVFQDLTARISTERMRADFLANASHELRTPLASLSLLIQTLAGPARENAADRDRFLQMMTVQAERMRRLIDDLLSLSRIELDEHVPPSDRADLAGVAHEAIDTLSALAAERNVRLTLTGASDPGPVVGDRFQLAQVIQNLIDNAIKYSPEGGEVRIEVGVSGDREEVTAKAARRWPDANRYALLSPDAAANRSYAYVRVEDDGPGISRHYLPRLGERFYRVERERGEEGGGTGLGLAIVKHIVNRHRGGLTVESQPGRGTAVAAYVESAGED